MPLIFVFAGLILLLLTGIAIFAALGLTTGAIMITVEGDIDGLGDAIFTQLNKPVLSTIRLFVFMAQVMIRAKVIDDRYTFANTVIGHVKGGLGVATVLSTSTNAIPQIKRFGHAERDALGVDWRIVSGRDSPGADAGADGFGLLHDPAPGTRRDQHPRQGWPAAVSACRCSVWALLAPPVVVGGIYSGIFTASKAAATCSLYALLIAIPGLAT